jgi:hypothetical protein
MVIDMNETQVNTVEKMRQVLAGTQALEFRQAGDDAGRYAWIDAVLRRIDYRQLKRLERGVVLGYLRRLSGYSRAQVTRLVSRWMARKPLVKQYRAPEHAFARRYTAPDVALLAEVDRVPWARSRGRPRPACCAASAMSSAMRGSSGWARSQWGTCTTCATARPTVSGASCRPRPARRRR